ncbi:hypothetical protein FACS189493_1570 [Spirochaetia bacterium]|nr:hypothetical protein FACS189493_1570 [Spirochaetia bacterium]
MITIETTDNVTEDGAAEEYVMKNDKGEVLCTGWRVKTDAEEKAAGESVIPGQFARGL